MNSMAFKYIHMGNTFCFEGQEYIKTNFNRGYYFENGRKVFKSVRKSRLVETTQTQWDTDE